MSKESYLWIKPVRNGKQGGVRVYIDKETWETLLMERGIPLDTPLENIRLRRYQTTNNLILTAKAVEA